VPDIEGTDTIDQIAKPEIVPIARGYRFDQAPLRAPLARATPQAAIAAATPNHRTTRPRWLALRHVARFNARMPRDPYVREKFTRESMGKLAGLLESISRNIPRIATRPKLKAGAICNREIMSSP